MNKPMGQNAATNPVKSTDPKHSSSDSPLKSKPLDKTPTQQAPSKSDQVPPIKASDQKQSGSDGNVKSKSAEQASTQKASFKEETIPEVKDDAMQEYSQEAN